MPGNNMTMETDSFPSLSKNSAVSVFCALFISFDVMINSVNLNNITPINHIGITLKYANVASDKIVYTVSEITSNFAPVLEVHFNFRAKYPSATSDNSIAKNPSNKIQFFVHS
jgi:hypothetical protein